MAEVLDSRERSFDEFFELLDTTVRFKNWANEIHPDASMVAEYLKAGSAQGWIGSLPAKVLRYVIGGSLDTSLPGTGSTIYGLADAFFVEKLFTGWRPNHFVDKRLKPFINA